MSEYSGNEIEALILKAARGGGMPLGYAEDLSTAAAFLDLGALTSCPFESGAAAAIPAALDRVLAGAGPQLVEADRALIVAYVTSAQRVYEKTLVWSETTNGAEFSRFEETATDANQPLGRRAIPDALAAHLKDLAAKILVPETEASRQAGAGAGLTDND